MTHRSRRLLKKLHRRWLGDVLVDASQASSWRSRLFDSKAGKVFEISKTDVSGLSLPVAIALRRFGLRFSVAAADPQDAEPWLSENGAVVFKFWATAFPAVRAFSGNNPGQR